MRRTELQRKIKKNGSAAIQGECAGYIQLSRDSSFMGWFWVAYRF